MMKRRIISILLILSMIILPCRNIAVAVATETIPACSCGNDAEDLSTHADGCDRKAYCRELCNHTAEELYEMWGKLPTDIREFVLTYLSWTDWNKLQELNQLLENFTDEDAPVYIPENPTIIQDAVEEAKDGCICEEKGTFGSISHDTACPYHFVNLTIEDEYIVYVTMASDIQTAALSLLDEVKRAELEAYIAAHPFASTVSEDGISVTAIDVPEGATITTEIVDHKFTESILPRMTLANNVDFALDIKVYNADGTEYQPSSKNPVMVKVSMKETKTGEKSDFIHILDTASVIEKGLADGSVKLMNLSYLFEEETEEGEIIEVTPKLSDAYWAALAATAELGYEKQIAYEILTGICVDDGYSTFYTDSFSTFSNSSLGSGTYYINHDLTGLSGHTGAGSNWKGFYTVKKDKGSGPIDYYYTEIGNVTVPSGNNVSFLFPKGNVPVSGTITVNGTLTMYLFSGEPDHQFWKYHWSTIWETERSLTEPYVATSNTIYRKAGNTGHLINVGSSGTLNLTGLSTSNPFIIDGKSIANAGAAIVSSGKVNLDYVNISNNYKSGGGGAIILQGSGSNTLDYVNISNCTATGNGGAIHVSASASATMNAVNISSCSGSYGGAVYASTTGKLEYKSSTITSCSSANSGGAFYITGSTNAPLTSINISSCTAGANGGGITITQSASLSTNTVNISGCAANVGGGLCRPLEATGGFSFASSAITNCTASSSGGGMYLGGTGTNSISSSTISGCQATTDGIAILLVTKDGSTTVTNSKIHSNKIADGSSELGGTIRSYGGTGGTFSTAKFEGCEIYSNQGGQHGGAFYWNAMTPSSLTIKDCIIHDNSVAQKGGGIFCESVMSIDGNTSIYKNTAKEGAGVCVNTYGGSDDHSNMGCNMKFASTISIYENTATDVGGGISMNVYDTASINAAATFSITLNGAKINNNTATKGGGIYIFRNTNAAQYPSSCNLDFGEFKNNTANNGNGGGVYTENVDVSIGNTAGTAMTISGNKAPNGIGGAVYSTGSLGSCSITNGTLTSNSANSGGAIGIDNGNVSVSGGTLSSNSATEFGGAIYTTGAGASCTVSNGTLQSNSSKYGGAIAVINGNITVNGGTISQNTASEYGGGIGVANGVASVEGGAVNTNTAGMYGGGIFAAGESAGITVSGNGSVSSNTAKNGGGIYATAGADVNVTGGIISYNSATGTPSATTAYNDGAASGVGGGIYVGNGTSSNSSSITISGSSVGLYGNTAAFAAADAYASGTYTVVSLPVVTNMNLTGYSGSAAGWFEDYANGDTGYTYGFMGGTVGERYANARTTREIASASGITKYAAITLGTTKTGYGNLTIHKSGTDIDQDQVFIFEVTGNNLSMVVSVVGTDSITIYELPDGTYTVTEITSWSWRYTPADGTMDTTISGTNVNPVLTFSNTRTNNDWLSAADNIINVKG